MPYVTSLAREQEEFSPSAGFVETKRTEVIQNNEESEHGKNATTLAKSQSIVRQLHDERKNLRAVASE